MMLPATLAALLLMLRRMRLVNLLHIVLLALLPRVVTIMQRPFTRLDGLGGLEFAFHFSTPESAGIAGQHSIPMGWHIRMELR
jgi:hypothetical protein